MLIQLIYRCTLSQPLTMHIAALTFSNSQMVAVFYLLSQLSHFTRFLCPLYLAMFWQTYNCQTCFVIDVQCLPMPYMRPGFYFCAVTIYEGVNPWPETTHTLCFPPEPKPVFEAPEECSLVGASPLVQATRDSVHVCLRLFQPKF